MSTCTLKGTLTDITGTPTKGQVVINLQNYASQPPVISGSDIIAATQITVQAASNGTWSTTLLLNSSITPANTFYKIALSPAGSTAPVIVAAYSLVTTGTIDLSSLTPLITASSSVSLIIPPTLAFKPSVADGIQFVAPEGLDTNDGLSWGTAKLTIRGAIVALPGGSTSPDIAGQGIVYFADKVLANSTGPTGCGIWLMGNADPNFSSPPSGWILYAGGALSIVGVPAVNGAVGLTKGRAQIYAGGNVDNSHPSIWLSNCSGPMQFSNIYFEYPARAILIGQTSNGLRDNTGNCSDIRFNNVSCNNDQTLHHGPTVDVTGQSFWIWFDEFGFEGSDTVNAVGSDYAASIMVDGRGNSGLGLIFFRNGLVSEGNIKLYPGINILNEIVIDSVTSEGTQGEPLVHICNTGLSGNNAVNVMCINLQVADASATNPAVQNDCPGNGVSCINCMGQGANIVGPCQVIAQYPPNLVAQVKSPLQQGQVGFFSDHVVGISDNDSRDFSPVAVRYANLAASDSTTWITSFAGATATVTQVTDPAGGTLAGHIVYGSGGQSEVAIYYVANHAINVGDTYICQAWVRSASANGYSGNTPIEIVLNAQGYGAGCTFTSGTAEAVAKPYLLGDGQWERVYVIGTVATAPANAGLAMVALTDVTHTLEVFGPTMIVVPSGTLSANEIAALGASLKSYSTAATVGSLASMETLAAPTLIQTAGGAPATASSTGTTGQIGWDSTHIYVCVATNTWVRATLATF